MKMILNLIACCCLVALIGCNSTESTASVNPGAIGDGSSQCCSKKADGQACPFTGQQDASPGAVSDGATCPKGSCPKGACPKGACPKDGTSGCCKDAKNVASPGAVSDSPACSKGASSCCKSKK